MDKLRIQGGVPLEGEAHVSGAKNAALPIMCAALLSVEPLRLANVPQLMDVRTMAKLLRQMGVEVSPLAEGRLALRAARITDPTAGYDLVKTMRASVLVLGPLLARCGRARVSLPGGCAIGQRPVDQHVKGLQAMGATVTIEHGYMNAAAERRIDELVALHAIAASEFVGDDERLEMLAVAHHLDVLARKPAFDRVLDAFWRHHHDLSL